MYNRSENGINGDVFTHGGGEAREMEAADVGEPSEEAAHGPEELELVPLPLSLVEPEIAVPVGNPDRGLGDRWQQRRLVLRGGVSSAQMPATN